VTWCSRTKLRVNSSRRKRRGRLEGKGATGFMMKIVPEVGAKPKPWVSAMGLVFVRKATNRQKHHKTQI
jgi:hypothetical protein